MCLHVVCSFSIYTFDVHVAFIVPGVSRKEWLDEIQLPKILGPPDKHVSKR